MIVVFLQRICEALLVSLGMFREVGWSLVLGFLLSALLQELVPRATIVALIGRDGVRETVLATVAGAASSSCSYAAAAVARTLLLKGGAVVPSFAFLFSSTNLVVELGIVLYLLMGWPFTAAEWLGGLVLIAILAVLLRLTCPTGLVDGARARANEAKGHRHGDPAEPSGTLAAKLRRRDTWVRTARHFTADWSMLWKDLLIGFLVAGALAVLVPDGVWRRMFLEGAGPLVQVPADALLGPVVAVLSFVCSIGNVPLAAVLWSSGVSFGGVLAFLYADLIVLPLLDVYRRYFGWRMAAYLAAVFYAAIVLAAIAVDATFRLLGCVPERRHASFAASMTHFSIDATFWLDLAFGVLLIAAVWLARLRPDRDRVIDRAT